MKRLKEIIANNILALEIEECEDCAKKEECDDKTTLEEIKETMNEDENKEFKVLMDSVREWYKEKTGQELTD